MTWPVAQDPLISLFVERKLLGTGRYGIQRPVTLVWQTFERLKVSFLVQMVEGHVDV
jgi:hypothetical protein